MKGVLFDIQRFAVHDGPGIRSTVFFKGCSARCTWCHNPESLSIRPQLQYYPDRCIACGKCAQLCPSGAHAMQDGIHTLDRSKCTLCGLCADECFSNALSIAGQEQTLQQVLTQLLEDKAYYQQSGGGVTLSGGEPVLQQGFALALLKALKAEGIHTCIQTAGAYPYRMIQPLLPYLDLVMYDVKGYDCAIYTHHIRADRQQILDNLARIGQAGIPIIARTPCVHPLNDTPQEIESIASMLSTIPSLMHYMLLPYHALGKAKYDALGEAFIPFKTPDKQTMAMLERLAARYVPVFNQEKGYILHPQDEKEEPCQPISSA